MNDREHLISDEEFEKYNHLLDNLAPPGQAPPKPGEPELDEPVPPPPPPPRWIWWLVAVATTGLTVAVALTAVRHNPVCAKLGLCSVDWINDIWRTLDLADSTANSLNQAKSVQGYEQKLGDLRKQVQHIEQRGVFGAAQRERLDRLRTITVQAQARLRQERSDQQTVREVNAEIPTLSGGLPGSQAAKKRQQLLERLNQVKPESFSSAEVQSLRQQLQPPPLPSPPLPSPPLPSPRRIDPLPVPKSAPEPSPRGGRSPLPHRSPSRSSPPLSLIHI